MHDVLPLAAAEVTAAGLPVAVVPALDSPAETTAYPTLSIGLESPRAVISIESSARLFPHDHYASVENEIRIESEMAGEVLIYAPLLAAFDSAPFPASDSLAERVSEFMTLLPKPADPALRSGARSYESSLDFRTSSAADEPAVFITVHPVTIVIGAWSACLMAQAYSPVPVELPHTRCHLP